MADLHAPRLLGSIEGDRVARHVAAVCDLLIASLILAVAPGPGVIYVLTQTLSQGRGAGLASVCGVALGNLANAAVAALGLAVVIEASSAAFTVVKFAGAAYLVFLGVQALPAARIFER
jgi:threonine/homoserine/homoserine lactone efflux protein